MGFTLANFWEPTQGPCATFPSSFWFLDDFTGSTVGTTNDASTYDYTVVNSGTVVLGSVKGGAAVLTTGTTATNHEAIVRRGSAYQTAASDNEIRFVARFKVEDADQDKVFIGLHEFTTLNSDFDVLAEATFDGIGFFQDHTTGGSPVLKYAVGNGTSHTTGTCTVNGASVTLSDDTYVEVAFNVKDRSRVTFFVNGQPAGTVTTNIPTNLLTLVTMIEALDTGGDDMTVDGWGVIQSNRG